MKNEGTTLKAAKREFMSWKSSTKQALRWWNTLKVFYSLTNGL